MFMRVNSKCAHQVRPPPRPEVVPAARTQLRELPGAFVLATALNHVQAIQLLTPARLGNVRDPHSVQWLGARPLDIPKDDQLL
jgi:hypothetical protein